MPLKIPFWQVVTYMPTNVREPTYDVVKSAILNGKIITNLDPTRPWGQQNETINRSLRYLVTEEIEEQDIVYRQTDRRPDDRQKGIAYARLVFDQ